MLLMPILIVVYTATWLWCLCTLHQLLRVASSSSCRLCSYGNSGRDISQPHFTLLPYTLCVDYVYQVQLEMIMMGVKWSTPAIECQAAFKDFKFTFCTSYIRQPIVLRDSFYTILYAIISGTKLNYHCFCMWGSWVHYENGGVKFATWPPYGQAHVCRVQVH